MGQRWNKLVVLCVLGCAAQSAQRGSQTPASVMTSQPDTRRFGPMTFDCDTLSDHFSRWSTELGGAAVVVTGTMRFAQEREHPHWVPTGTVGVAANDEFVNLSVSVREGPTLHVGARHRPPRDAPLSSKEIGVIAFSREPLAFEMRVAGADVSFNIAGHRHNATLDRNVERVELSCNTANVLFEDVVVELR